MVTSFSMFWCTTGRYCCRHPKIASAAAAIARHWQELGGLGGVPFAMPSTLPGAKPLKGSMGPYGHPLGPPTSGAAHPSYLPPPPPSSTASPHSALQPALLPPQQQQQQQPAQQLESRPSANSEGGPGESGFGDRSVVVHEAASGAPRLVLRCTAVSTGISQCLCTWHQHKRTRLQPLNSEIS